MADEDMHVLWCDVMMMVFAGETIEFIFLFGNGNAREMLRMSQNATQRVPK